MTVTYGGRLRAIPLSALWALATISSVRVLIPYAEARPWSDEHLTYPVPDLLLDQIF